MNNRLMESLSRKVGRDLEVRRYSLPEMISESYRLIYTCEENSNLKKLAESHLEDIRNNPTDIDRLSRQLAILKETSRLIGSRKLSDKDLVERKVNPSTPKRLKETAEPNRYSRPMRPHEEAKHCDECDVKETEDLQEETELTDEEIDELTKHLEEIRKKKNTSGSSTPTQKTDESVEDLVDDNGELVDKESHDTVDPKEKRNPMNESKKTWKDIDLSKFNENSSNKAFMKTFKKLNDKLHEGTALTRQESIGLYKAANSAMTHLSVELEHNPEFLGTFKEAVSILSADVNRLLESLANGKAPSKKNMKSLAKFSETILSEAEDETEEDFEIPEEDEDFIGDDEGEIESEESEEFDQEYADARVELHKQLVVDHADDEDPAIQEKIAQDAAEVLDLPGITDEQAAEISGETPDDNEEEEAPEDPDESPDEEIEPDEEEDIDDGDITDDELEELKRHLKEMRSMKTNSLKEASSYQASRGDFIRVKKEEEEYYINHGYKPKKSGYQVKNVENYGVFIKEYNYMIPHSDYEIVKK